ncbi:hypothetical protein E2562_016959 [Oryza meyeriana var. granulata]|uniref:Uncharacterized protein n=1 Tax=Oryza meyeriana var. granulata TaxID=110450 RepID=A0A6G1DZP2_9ORYZ|nr:hypothetical protein E2562_016959 [Oryza meyeriana var. granulata]
MVARRDGVVRGDSLEEERTQGRGERGKEADDPEFYRATCGCARRRRRGNRGYTLLGLTEVTEGERWWLGGEEGCEACGGGVRSGRS